MTLGSTTVKVLCLLILAQHVLCVNKEAFAGRFFALLDGTPPKETKSGCQKEELPLPDSWKLADASDFLHRFALSGFTWGTTCVVFKDGTSLTAHLDACGTNQLLTNKNNYTVANCDQRILIVKDTFDDAFESTAFHNFTLWNSAFDSYVLDLNENITAATSPKIPLTEVPSEGFSLKLTYSTFNLTQASGAGGKFVVLVTITYSESVSKQYSLELKTGNVTDRVDWLDVVLDHQLVAGNTTINATFRLENLNGSAKVHPIQVVALPHGAFNVLQNPSFNAKVPGNITEWVPFGYGYITDIGRSPSPEPTSSSECPLEQFSSLMVEINPLRKYHDHGAQQVINKTLVSQVYPTLKSAPFNLYVGGFSKALSVSGVNDDNYCIYVDIQYENGGGLYGQAVQWSTGVHDWEWSDRVWTITQNVSSITVTALMRYHTGLIWFDNFVVALQPIQQDEANTHSVCKGAIFGDPRIITFDSAILYSLQATGEFTLSQSPRLEVQVRLISENANNGTVTTAVAIGSKVLPFNVSIEINPDSLSEPIVYFNSALIGPNITTVFLPSSNETENVGGVFIKKGSFAANPTQSVEYILCLSSEEMVKVVISGLFKDNSISPFNISKQNIFQHIQLVSVLYPRSHTLSARVIGLLGVCGEAANHSSVLWYRDGTTKVGPYTNLTDYAQSWLVSPNDLYLHHNPGQEFNFSMAKNFTMNQMNSASVYKANWYCMRQFLGVLNDSCLMDVILNGLNGGYSLNYHQIESEMGLISTGITLISVPTRSNGYIEYVTSSWTWLIVGVAVMVGLIACAFSFIILRIKKKKPARTYSMVSAEDSEL